MKNSRTYIVTVRVRSIYGTRPVVRNLMGDTVFVSLTEGQSATWTVKRQPQKVAKRK